MNRNVLALLAGALAGAAYQLAGHYGLRKPRLEIRAPWTYVYGCIGIWAGCAIRDWLGDERLTTAEVSQIMAANGAAVFCAYMVDAMVTVSHSRYGDDEEVRICGI